MTVLIGDCRDVLATMADNSVDSVVTDPPYELGFMGKKWDASGIAYDVAMWREVLRVLKPGGYLLSFGGTRTYHRMACAIEDAGFTIRDCLQWLYGSGFPKSLNVSKAIDAAAGATREVVGVGNTKCPYLLRGEACPGHLDAGKSQSGATVHVMETAPATALAQQWDGFGTALKPACEPIVLAQKPLEGTYAANLAKWGVGALNIDGCRIGSDDRLVRPAISRDDNAVYGVGLGNGTQDEPSGRWPANVLLDDGAAAELDRQSGFQKSGTAVGGKGNAASIYGSTLAKRNAESQGYGDSGGASRFFYVAKASRKERDQGCEHLPAKTAGEATDRQEGTAGLDNPRAGAGRTGGAKNYHPTVKPIQLMRYLCRLVTPPGGLVLDPFTGSGTTGTAARSEGFHFTGIELSEEYATIARARLASVVQPTLFAAAD